jgi:hypothetical protein
MTETAETTAPKNSETDPPAANQALHGDDLEAAGGAASPSSDTDTDTTGKPAPTPVPVAAPHGGQVPAGKPDGEVDTGR